MLMLCLWIMNIHIHETQWVALNNTQCYQHFRPPTLRIYIVVALARSHQIKQLRFLVSYVIINALI